VDLLERSREIDPPGETMFPRERELYVAQPWLSGWGGKGSLESSARFGVTVAKRLEPSFCFPLEILEGALRRELPVHGAFLRKDRLTSAE
jgi:hypothetical protein